LIGVYEIGPLVGRGGMGEVYRARDTRLKRDVAIKFLPSHLAQDPERVRRFEHEAETLAALNHPNIAAIHALEISNNVRFLVMEFVEGETLDERIGGTPLPEDEALAIGRQICSALAVAHDRGIVHRDLKPANIKIAPDRRVKLLDFGLARMFAPEACQSDLSDSPTITASAGAHVISGTAAYMAPEQARGLAIDRRADMWALGCLLFEMLTGRPVFSGDTVPDILAAVVTREPPIGDLPAGTSSQVRWLVARCLQKDLNTRFRDAADAAAVLGMTVEPALRAARSPWRQRTATGAVAVVVGLAMLGVVKMLNSKSAPPLPPVRFDVPVNAAPVTQPMAISPDGRQIAFVGSPDATHFALWLRRLDALDAKLIRGTETLRTLMSPAFSLDGGSIAFVADGKLKRIDASGGSAATLAYVDSQIGGIAWGRDDILLFASNDHGLRRVSASGGEVVSVTERDTTLDETYHDCPVILPDGRHFLYLAYSVAKPENRAVYIGSLDSKGRTRLMPSDSCVKYSAPGFVLFSRGRTIVARPFDARELKLAGEAVAIVDDVATFSNDELAAFAVSDGGTLIYRKVGVPETTRSLVWIDRNGKVSEPIGAPIQSTTPVVRLSPDNRFIAFSTAGEGRPDDIWTHDLQRNIRLRLTSDEGVDHLPVWSPDGSQLMFDSHRSGKGSAIYRIPANGAVAERLFLQPEGRLANGVNDWSRDGRFLVFQQSATAKPPWSLWGLPLFGERKPFVYKTSAADNVGGRLSPNGRWLAYATTESGTSQVVVQPFPDPSGGKWQVSSTGGSNPIWRRDGRELYYINSTSDLVAVEVKAESAFAIAQSTTLFRTALGFATPGFPYDVSADGMRFVFAIPSGNTTPPITTILNWSSLIRAN
jgi:Tol biopolymer transport system component